MQARRRLVASTGMDSTSALHMGFVTPRSQWRSGRGVSLYGGRIQQRMMAVAGGVVRLSSDPRQAGLLRHGER